ncbi:MAG TPA: acyl--CoA ligase family protein [Candidatus Acidoferrales bacterium]|nr:acyl--CoA ligase family protein [Candidatus Acidoferrales bacterium]
MTPLELLARSASVYRDSIAVVDGERRITYSQFNQRVHRFASALARQGVAPRDRVAVLARNGSLALESHFGVPLAGAALVMLNVRLQPAELARILTHCGAKLLLGEPRLLAPLESLRGTIPALREVVADYEQFLGEGDPSFESIPPEEESVIAINYTSGTTGEPKGVMYTHRGAYLNAVGEILEHGLSPYATYLWTLPMFHCNGWCFPWAVTAAGARHVCLPDVNPALVVELILQEGVTHLCGAPVVLLTLTEYCRERGIRLNQRLKIVTAGAPPTPAVIRAAEQMGAEVAHAYGLTETYGPHSICAWQPQWDGLPQDERAQLKSRQGVPYLIAGTGMRVVDAEMNDVPADGKTMGEVVMRGNNVMLGYYRDPAATATAFRGGWFHSGDLAVAHPDGYIELRDRSKDIIISGGENISSVEVEKVLAEHPAVLEAAVVGVPDPKWGEVPLAQVALRDGLGASERDLIDFCRGRLAHFKCPKYVRFGPLPKTSTGKVRKNILRSERRPAGEGA